MIKQYKLRFYNFRLLLFLLAISSIGVVLVGTAREDLMLKQLMGEMCIRDSSVCVRGAMW